MRSEQLDTALRGFGRLLVLVAAIIALFSVKERMYLDASYYFFHTLNEGFPRIDHDRFILALAELPILIGGRLRLGLGELALLYSVGHVLIFLIFQWIVVKRYGQWRHGLLIGILMFVGVSHLFFSPMLELWYGLILLVVFDAFLLHRSPTRPTDTFWVTILSLSILCSHPECFIPYLLVLLLHAVNKRITGRQLIGFLLLMTAVASYKFATFSAYEGGKVSKSLVSPGSYIDRLMDIEAYSRMILMFVRHYGLLLILAGVGWLVMWNAKRRKEAVLILLFIVGFLIFIRLTIGSSTYGRYNQSVFLPFVFMAAYLFITAWPHIRKAWSRWAIVIVLLLCCLRWISETIVIRSGLSERVASIEQAIEVARENGGRLIIEEVDSEQYPDARSFSWSLGIESLIFSSMDGGRAVSVIRRQDLETGGNAQAIDLDEVLLTRWAIRPIEELDERYFEIGEGEYVPTGDR